MNSAHTIKPIDFSIFSEAVGTRLDQLDEATYGSIIEYVKAGGYVQDVPVQVSTYIVLDSPNKYGDTVLMEAVYDSLGHLTCAGGKLDDHGNIVWSCYAD